MNSDRYQRIKEIFSEACALDHDRRSVVLDRQCAGDAELRRELESLLAHADAPVVDLELAASELEWKPDNRSDDTPPFDRIGDYQIIRVLGAGGMGVVYLAEQENPRRTVALKVIRPAWASSRTLHRFKREAQALGRLQHPGIAQIFEAGTADTGHGEQPYYVMEYVRGVPLLEHAEAAGLSARDRLALVRSICDAVQHAHQRGVIHRDLKPSNILVDEQGQPRILDFGIARFTEADVQASFQTESGELIGTLPYMSPEQVCGDSARIDARADVYALGAVCYELLTGRYPHDLKGKSLPESVRTISEDVPTPLSSVNRIFRGDVDTIVAKALEKDASRRYQSAAEFAADIERHLGDQPITARPPSTLYQFRKFARRNKAIVGGAAAVLVISVVGAIVSTSLAVAEANQRRIAQARAQELEQVTRFQSSMLSELDAEVMGREIIADLRNRAHTRLNERGLGDDAAANALAGFDDAVTDVNATDLALKVVDDRILRRAIETIDTDFSDQPVVRAALQRTLAVTYRELGLYEQGLSLAQEALLTRRDELGNDHPDTLEAIHGLGYQLQLMSQYDEALPLFDEALEGRRRVLGDEHPATLATIGGKGHLLQEMGRYDEAEPYLRESLEIGRRVRGQDHKDTLIETVNLGLVMSGQGKYDEAESAYRTALEGFRRIYGDDHPHTLAARNNLGAMLFRAGEIEEALEYYRETWESLRRVNGDDHPDTLLVLGNLGHICLQLERYDEAIEYSRGAVEGFRRALGDDHQRTLIAIKNMGVLLGRIGDLEAAVPYLREALEGTRRSLGDDHSSTVSAMNSLAGALRDSGRLEEAVRLGEQATTTARRVLPDGHRSMGVYLHSYGQTLTELNRFAETEPVLEEAYEILASSVGPQHERTIAVVDALIALHTAWNGSDPEGGHEAKVADWRAKLTQLQEPPIATSD